MSKDIFGRIYEENLWRDSESKSGTGSNLVQTEALRKKFPGLLREYNVKSVIDVPCGDFNWMKEIKSELSLIIDSYIGGDIVKDLVAINQQLFMDSKFNFQLIDVTSSGLPAVDLILCRDCLVHLSYTDI